MTDLLKIQNLLANISSLRALNAEIETMTTFRKDELPEATNLLFDLQSNTNLIGTLDSSFTQMQAIFDFESESKAKEVLFTDLRNTNHMKHATPAGNITVGRYWQGEGSESRPGSLFRGLAAFVTRTDKVRYFNIQTQPTGSSNTFLIKAKSVGKKVYIDSTFSSFEEGLVLLNTMASILTKNNQSDFSCSIHTKASGATLNDNFLDSIITTTSECILKTKSDLTDYKSVKSNAAQLKPSHNELTVDTEISDIITNLTPIMSSRPGTPTTPTTGDSSKTVPSPTRGASPVTTISNAPESPKMPPAPPKAPPMPPAPPKAPPMPPAPPKMPMPSSASEIQKSAKQTEKKMTPDDSLIAGLAARRKNLNRGADYDSDAESDSESDNEFQAKPKMPVAKVSEKTQISANKQVKDNFVEGAAVAPVVQARAGLFAEITGFKRQLRQVTPTAKKTSGPVLNMAMLDKGKDTKNHSNDSDHEQDWSDAPSPRNSPRK